MMSLDTQNPFEEILNPLDSVEDVLTAQNWTFTRAYENELSLQVNGSHCLYNLTFLWQEDYNALQLFCECDLTIPKKRQDMAAQVLRTINEQLWLGHFDVTGETKAPVFRYTSLLGGMQNSHNEHTQNLIDIALAESERYSAVFALLSRSLYLDESLIDLALSDTGGRA